MQLRARAHLDLGQLEAASQDYMQAVKLDPGAWVTGRSKQG